MKEGISINRKYVSHNPYQGKYKKVLCVCSAGLLRSPTVAFVLSQEPFNFNTRACGMDEGIALILLDEVLLEWADEVVCMDGYQKKRLSQITTKPIFNLEIGDIYEYRDPELIKIIAEKYQRLKEDKEVSK